MMTQDAPIESTPDSRRTRTGLVPLVWGALLIVGLTLLLPNYGFYGDNLVYAADVELRDWSLKVHPHHIGFSPLIWALWQLATRLGLECSALDVMSALSRLATLGCAYQLAWMALALRITAGWSAWAVLIFGLAFSVWDYGTNGAVYLPTLFAVLLAIRTMWGWPTSAPTRRDMVALGSWFLVAVAFHELAILLMPSCIVWGCVCAYWRQESWWRGGYRVLLTLAGPVLYLYVFAFFLVHRSFDPQLFFAWMTKYSEVDRYWWWNRAPADQSMAQFFVDLVVLAHGRLMYALPIETVYRPATEDPYAMALQVAWTPELLVLCTRVLMVLAVVWLVAAGIAVWRKQPELRWAQVLCLLWALPIVAFLCFFQPQAPFYRIYEFIPLLLLSLLPFTATQPSSPVRRSFGMVMAMVLTTGMAVNFAYGWEPRAHPRVNPHYAGLAGLEALPAGALGFLAVRENRPAILHTTYFLDRPVYLIEHFSAYNVTSSPALREGPPLQERLAAGRAWLASQPNGVWISETTWRRQRADAGDPRTPAWRYLRLFDPQPDIEISPELWIDLTGTSAASHAGEAPYGFRALAIEN